MSISRPESCEAQKIASLQYDLYPNWSYLPDSILLQIFSYLNVSYIPIISTVCKKWWRVSNDEFLWKKFLMTDFNISKKNLISKSWLEDYRRLVEEIPIVETECLDEHNHQVLHVSFSHDGKMFATSSKDGFIVVWTTSHPVEVIHHKDMKYYSWKYTQFSQFNEDNSLLLVSGVHFGTCSTSGEIAVFNLNKDFQLQCRVLNKPYDIFGTWYNKEYLFSGELKWLGQMVSANIIWLNKAKQELESEHEAILSRMFQFYNLNASSIRTVLVAECHTEDSSGEAVPMKQQQTGNPPSIPVLASSSDSDDHQPCLKKPHYAADVAEYGVTEKDKYLIFTTGSKTYSPHQVGLKRIRKFKIPKLLDAGPGIRERLLQRKEELQMKNEGRLIQPDWLDYEAVKDKFDDIDYLFDLNGHIIGMCLSPDNKYLYVNSRPWPKNCTIENPLEPPIIAQEIDIHVIDLVNLKEVGVLLRSHKAYTPNADCFFIFLDVSHDYVASGAEDRNGYIWDRNYEVCLAKIPHKDVVNSVAFNPQNPQMMVSVSDDHKIKVWRSKKWFRENGISFTKDQIGKEMRIKRCRSPTQEAMDTAKDS